ncbi:hypothetical protein GUJ93_ZPchr0011g28132 [Zizania palustris]|uniref:Bifunctional inhibitor/plant lipid transfer protein/seed storage helical domain-containing protein n=1 Tax=Zizania palustris TaxID=103762 RepID=A0A8J5WJX8_ZIZPA|nr:hypothetical protein GUJ93_ZPchr0011g28132 [Zizania palustris]
MACFLLVVLALALAVLATVAGAGDEYCRDNLDGLLACHDFMFDGAPAASPACCAAYDAAFNANPFCLCYIVNGVYGRSTGYDVNVTHAMEIPVSCGLVTPPIELCGMQGLVLPPYEPSAQSPVATTADQPPVASAPPPPQQTAVPSSPFTLPPPTSDGVREFLSMPAVYVVVAAVVSSLAWIISFA